MAEAPFRVLPKLTPSSEAFWTGGEHGELRFLRCAACRSWVHPPQPVCPRCYQKQLEPETVSGRAHVYSYTVNHQAWIPGLDEPYVIAIVAIEEDPSLRLTTNLVDCEPEAVTIGMPVQVVFEQRDDVWIPLFRPADA
jgi:uncharacterized OB-fold protein